MSIERKLLLAMAAILIAACAGPASGPQFVKALEPSADDVLVYIYRPSKYTGSAIAPGIRVNDDVEFVLRGGGYTYLYLPPGKHKFDIVAWDHWEGGATEYVDTESGKTYFLKLHMSSHGNHVSTTSSFYLSQPSVKRGFADIGSCKYIHPDKYEQFKR